MCSLKDWQNFFLQSLPLCTSCLFSMFLNDDIVGIEKINGMCAPNFVVDEFSGLFLHSLIFSIKHWRYALMINGFSSVFLYWLNSNIEVFSKESQHYKNLYLYIIFNVIEICFWLQKNEGNLNNENHGGIFTLILLMMHIIFPCNIMSFFFLRNL